MATTRRTEKLAPQEIGVERVTESLRLDRAGGRDQSLGQHLAAKDALDTLRRRSAAEDIFLQLFQVQQDQKPGQRPIGHRLSPPLARLPSRKLIILPNVTILALRARLWPARIQARRTGWYAGMVIRDGFAFASVAAVSQGTGKTLE
jgi:hypothetical protein